MDILLIFLGLAAGAIFGALIMRVSTRQTSGPDPQLMQHMATLGQQQAELTGRLTSFAEAQEAARGQLNRTLSERLDAVSQNLDRNLKDAGEKTGKTLGELGQRLALIDKAQQEITHLSSQVVELQHILDNKQARGAFGETQLADIVADGLPAQAYALQHTLSNGKRADCLIRLPNPPGPVVVDSKFPLEAYRRLTAAEDDAAQKTALQALRTDTLKHAQDIADKYILSGETADAALMFLPSESVFSEIHLRLPDTIDKCRAMRVYPVSPNTMSLTLNTVRAIMRDVKMREQAGRIQQEVEVLVTDINRLGERVGNLRKHFDMAQKDIGLIETSQEKITKRGGRITGLDIEATETDEGLDLLGQPE